MLFFGAVLGMMAISKASSIAQHMIGMTPAEAAVAVSVLALFNTFGRVVAGMISDKIGCIQTVRMVFFAAIAAMAILYLSGSQKAAIFYTGICLAGICFGAFMGVYPSFTAEQFGRKNSSVNYGIMFIGFNLAGLVGPMIVSFVFQQTGDYSNAFLIALVFAAAGLCLSFAYRKMLQKGRQDVSI